MIKTATSMITVVSLGIASSASTPIITEEKVTNNFNSSINISRNHDTDTKSPFIIKYEEIKTISNAYIPSEQEDNGVIQLHSLLNSYEQLPENWDGYDGIAPKKSVIEATVSFLDKLTKESIKVPKSMLSGTGEVSLYWEVDNTYIEIGFEDSIHYTYLIDNKGEAFGEDDYPLMENIPNQLIQALKTISV